MSKLTIASLVLCGVFSTISVAADSIGEKFKQLDRNDDGLPESLRVCTRPSFWSRFQSYDKDKDNKLSLAEFEVYAYANK